MKKVLLTGNILLFVLFLMAYTADKPGTPPPPNTSIQLGIDPSLSRQMLVEYRDKVWRTRNINGAAGKDARSVWFSLEKLKAFIADIEGKVGNSCIDSYGLGIRIYYANYPDSVLIRSKGYDTYFQNHNLPMEYKNHHTVVMVPTYWNNTYGHNYDFDPRFRSSQNACEFTPIKDVMTVLFSNGPYSDSSRTFTESGVVQNKKSFMIMPDNLDTRRFRPEFEFGIKQSKKRGDADNESDFGGQSDFTNGGTLIPPPYPEEEEGNGTAAKTMQNINNRRALLEKKIHIPSSGASYMRWVDDTNDTGWVLPSLKLKQANPAIKNFQ